MVCTFPSGSYLANSGGDNRMVGELALEGHLTIGLFPKLGYLDGLRRLLQGGADFSGQSQCQQLIHL